MNVDNLKDIDELKEEMKQLKEETVKEKTKQNKQNTIKYRFYSTKKVIPWMLGGENLKPTPDISDNYFDFVELPPTKQFEFKTPFVGEIVCDSDEYTYWKVERYTNGSKDRTFYFYTSRILEYLKNGYKLELSLDLYLTYTKDVINSLKNKNIPVKVNRCTITSQHLLKNNEDTKTILKSLRNVDDNISNSDDTYILNRGFSWINTDKDDISVDYSKLPLFGNKLTFQNKDWGYFNNPTTTNPTGGFWYGYGGDGNQRYRSIFDSKKKNIVYIDKDYYLTTNPHHPQPYEHQKQWNDYLGGMCGIELIKRDNLTTEQINQLDLNIMNSYFMVFRNVDGYYDCYPILGKLSVKYRVPSVCVDSDGLTSNEYNHNSYNPDIPTRNRVYSTEFTVIDGELYNDFDSIYNEYVINQKSWYPGDNSFIGIFRGIIPSGKESNMNFVIKENSTPDGSLWFPQVQVSNFQHKSGGRTYRYKHCIPVRIFYRMKYSDVSNMWLKDVNSKSGYFELTTPQNYKFIDNYINLLQPISIGNTEFIPIRYCYLSKKKTGDIVGFTIPFSMSFNEGFKCFLNDSYYNNPSLTISFGGTLPIKTPKYERIVEQIEIQKNNGVGSSIGNIISRPINWFSGGFGLSSTVGRINQKGFLDDFDNEIVEGYGIDKNDWLYGDRIGRTSRNFGGNVGGLGGFIGDFINIDNTIKQSEYLKRNTGLGYITSLDDDLLSSIVHYNFLKIPGDKPSPIRNNKIHSVLNRKIFSDTTKLKYSQYFHNYGFLIGDFLSSSFINPIIDYLKQFNETGFFQLDKDWCLVNLGELSRIPDNTVKKSIIDELSKGIRMKKYF